ncbi:MAG: hypothetical protein ACWIPI_07575 [Polaribacter sp.]
MLMKTLFLKTTFLLFTLTLSNCENKDPQDPQDQLPPITQTGANTFGCIINDKVLIPKDKTGYTPPGGGTPKGIIVKHRPNNNFIIDVANLKDNGSDDIYIYIYNLTSTGIYNLGLSNNQTDISFSPNYSHAFCRTYDGVNQGKVYLSNLNSGTITITRFDPVNFIVSGTFELSVFNKDNPNETIEVTDGRFDVNWSTL